MNLHELFNEIKQLWDEEYNRAQALTDHGDIMESLGRREGYTKVMALINSKNK